MRELESKKLESDSTKIETFFKLQEELEKKFENVMDNLDEKEPRELLLEIEKFINYLSKNNQRIAGLDNNYYGIDLSRLYRQLIKLDSVDAIQDRVALLKEKIISYIFSSFKEEDLRLQTRFFTELQTFNNIDFSKIKNLNNGSMEGTPEITFKNCTIDLDNFGYFLSNNTNLILKSCRFKKSSLRKSIKENKEDLESRYGFRIEKEGNESNRGKTFLDRRPEDNITLCEKDLEYYELEITADNYINNSKVQKSKIAEELIMKLNDNKTLASNISVRYSTNYADEKIKTEKPRSYVSDREWQSWHSIDLELDGSTEQENTTVECIKFPPKKYYAFITPDSTRFQVLLFSKEQLQNLLENKIKKLSYTRYTNANDKEYIKFNFYFTTSDDKKTEVVRDEEQVPIDPNNDIKKFSRKIKR